MKRVKPSQANVSFQTLFLGGRFFATLRFTPLTHVLLVPPTIFKTPARAVAWRPEDMYRLMRDPGEGV